MNRPALEILIVLLLLVANGVFAMAEIAVISARKARLRRRAEEGHAGARAALELATRPNRFLATVQIGITLVGILAGAFGGATLAEEIAVHLADVPALAPHAEAIGVGVVVLVITYLSLVIGELVPKRLGLAHAERIAAAAARPMSVLSRLASPVVRFLDASTGAVIRLIGVKPSSEPVVTPEEIRALVQQGAESGVFEPSEQDMIENVLRLDDRRVGAFMTPRTRIVALDVDDSPAAIRERIAANPFSRYPVVRGTLDEVIGTVRARDLLAALLAGRPLDLGSLVHPPVFIPGTMSGLRALELFRREGTHIALITSEYGGIEGMITHNDILEDIAGRVAERGDADPARAVRREDGSWLVDGLLPLDRLEDLVGEVEIPEEEEGSYRTVGGFVMARISGIPAAGQRFRWGSLEFEVMDMDGLRVDKVLIVPVGHHRAG